MNKNLPGRVPLAVKIIAVAVVGLAFFGYQKFFGSQSSTPSYQTAEVTKGTLIVSISGSGSISSTNGVDVLTQATGVVTTVYAKNGDTVKAGQKLADIQLDQDGQANLAKNYASYLSAKNSLTTTTINQASLEQAVLSANQGLSNADSSATTATQDYQEVANKSSDDPDKQKARLAVEAAHSAQDAAKLNIDVATQKYQMANDNIAQAKASLNSSWLTYEQTLPTITAPVDGVLTNFALTPGNTISGSGSSSSSTSLTSQTVGTVLLPQGQVQAIVNLTEIDVVGVKADQKATLTMDAFPNKTFTGKVLAVNTSGSVSSGVTTYPTTIAFDTNPDGVYPNMGASAKIITKVVDNVLLVPSAAITTSNGESSVKVLKNGQVATVTVTVGDSNDTNTVVTSGLNEGYLVVTGTTPTTTPTTTSGSSVFSSFGGNRSGGAVRSLTTGH